MLPVVLLAIFSSAKIFAEEVYFNPDSLEIGTHQPLNVDLSLFEKGHYLPPGDYQVELLVNGNFVTSSLVTFIADSDKNIKPLLTPVQIRLLGLILSKEPSGDEELIDIKEYIPDIEVKFNAQILKLELNVPQTSLKILPRGYIDPSYWNQGINALILNYNLSGFHTFQRGNGGINNRHYYLNLRSGLNLGAWRLRNYSIYQINQDSPNTWQNVQLYAQRDIQFLRSQFYIGEQQTQDNLFDSFPYRGIQLQTDDAMLAESLQGFSPIIRGIAKSNARVIVKQNSYIIYETSVPPGPFEISDLYQISTGEELEVIIIEADGEERSFFQNAAALPIMEREGNFKYTLASGRYWQGQSEKREHPAFGQLTMIYGLPYDTTVYTGFLKSNVYSSGLLGTGKSLGTLGAVSFDTTYARSQMNNLDETVTGLSYQLQYVKNILATNTTLGFAARRYTKKPFYTFQQVMESEPTISSLDRDLQKTRLQVNVSQYLSGNNSIYFNASLQDFWNTPEKIKKFELGYSTVGYNSISYAFNYNYAQSLHDSNNKNQQFSINIQVPVNSIFSTENNIGYQWVHNNTGRSIHSVSLRGVALEDKNLSYFAQKNVTNKDNGGSSALSFSYLGSQGQITSSYGQDYYSKKFNYSLTGGVIAHAGGVTLSQPLGETVALVNTQKVKGVRFKNSSILKTDYFGYAVVPYISPYRNNSINVDVDRLNENIDALKTSNIITPTQGAVVKADFVVRSGYRAIISLTHNGSPVPFGTTVYAMDGKTELSQGISGNNGETYLSGLPEAFTLKVAFGEKQGCQVKVNLEKHLKEQLASDILFFNIDCH